MMATLRMRVRQHSASVSNWWRSQRRCRRVAAESSALQSFSSHTRHFQSVRKGLRAEQTLAPCGDLFGVVKDSTVCTIVTYNTSIDSLTRQDDMAGATELLRDMSIKSATPDMIVYSTLIWGSCARGDLEQGIKLLGAIQGRGTAPDVVLLNSTLDQTTVELQAFPRVDMLASAWHGQRTHASAGGLRRGSLR